MKKTEIDLRVISKKVESLLSYYNNENTISSYYKLLNERINNPQCYITLLGETSSGKSSIINGFYKSKLLPTSVQPTTGTVTHLCNISENSANTYYAISRESTIEQINKEQFLHLSTKPDKNLLRLYIETPPPEAKYEGLNIIDTPGYNSIYADHEQILREFLPESNIIIYVISYRSGFSMQDSLMLDSINDYLQIEEIPILVVINRCPDDAAMDSKRIQEIRQYVSSVLPLTDVYN